MRRFVAAAGLALLACIHSEAVDFDSLKPIAPVESAKQTATGAILDCTDGSQIAVDVLAPDLVRVRASHGQALTDGRPTGAIAKTNWPTTKFEFDGSDPIRISTSAVTVEITRSPVRVRFVSPVNGSAINEDYAPMQFDATGAGFGVRKKLGFDEHFYGLGEKAAHIDRRRNRFTMWNTDAYGYKEGTDPLYQSIPFYIGLENGRAYGIFYDNSFRSSFDFGSSDERYVSYTADGGPLTYYFFAGPDMKQIVPRYTELTGRMPLPPRWALGHQQSRYSYYPDSEVLKVAQTYREHDLPLDVIHLDIHYMRGYRDFTFDPEKFPDPKELTGALKKTGVKIVTIVDPGIKYEPQDREYGVFTDGISKNAFVKRSSGELYIPKVWPGDAVFVDWTKPEASKWWGDQFQAYLNAGVSGIWTDMNEPSDFNDQTGKSQMDVVFGNGASWLENRNLFALEMAKATREGLLRLHPDERPYIITRAGFAGVQRYTTMWTGDNTASWDSFAISLPMYESLGLSGEAFVGGDVGGFIGKTNAELLTRWYEVGFLTPFFRNHAESGGYDHEPWRFGPYYEAIIRKYIKLRYRLLPFLYTKLAEAHSTGLALFRPLILNYQNDANAQTIDDEFMIGDELLAAPVLGPNQDWRTVYLPAGTWFDFWTGKKLTGGTRIKVDAPLDTIPLFVRAGSIIPLGPDMRWSDEKPLDPLTVRIYPDANGSAHGSLYEDDGRSQSYEQGAFRSTAIRYDGKQVSYQVAGSYSAPNREIQVEVIGK